MFPVRRASDEVDAATVVRRSFPVRIDYHGMQGHQSEVHEGSDLPAQIQSEDPCLNRDGGQSRQGHSSENRRGSGCNRRNQPKRPANVGNPDRPEPQDLDGHDKSLIMRAPFQKP